MLTQRGFCDDANPGGQLPSGTGTAITSGSTSESGQWVNLGLRLPACPAVIVPRRRWFLMIDDTIVFRSSKKAPGSVIHFQHGNKTNRPTFVRGQCWVTLALTLSKGFRSLGIPIPLPSGSSGDGNSGKLVAAKTLLRVIAPWLRVPDLTVDG